MFGLAGSTGFAGVIEHWDGLAWSVVPGAYQGNSTLSAVAAIAPDDVWVVGDRSGLQGTLLEHWDGRPGSSCRMPTQAPTSPRYQP